VRNRLKGGTIAEGLLGDEYLLYERAVLLKDLDSIVMAIPHVYQPIIRDSNGVNETELFRYRFAWIVWAKIGIVWFVTVRSPVTFVRSRVRVEHDDPLIEVSVGNIDLVGFGIHCHVRGMAQEFRVVAAARFPRVSDLQ